MRYRWESATNPNMMVLHVDRRLPRACAASGRLDESTARELDDDDRGLVDSLLSIDGVDGVYLAIGGRYKLSITRGHLFAWGPIREAVVAALRAWPGSGGEMVEAVGFEATTRADAEQPDSGEGT